MPGEPGDVVAFDVLALFDGETSQIGAPLVAGASVAGEIVSHGRGPKVIAFKKRRRKNSRRKRGHKQDLTVVRITEFLTGGAKPAAKATTEAPAASEQRPPEADSYFARIAVYRGATSPPGGGQRPIWSLGYGP